MDKDPTNENNLKMKGARIGGPYVPLKEDTGDFRLLLLEPGRHDDELQIQLQPAWLIYPPCYEALSYVWGTELAPYPVVANGKYKLAITRNLDSALRHLRQPRGTRTLWVDALCIDQDNVEERNMQVQKMAQLYFSSHKTAIWLGPDEGHDYNNLLLHMDKRTRPKSDASFTQLLKELCHLTKSPWFSRLWVLQELIMPRKDPMVYIGRFRIPWRDFQSGASYFNDLYLEHPNTRLTVEDPDLIGKCLHQFTKIQGFNRLRDCGRESSLEARLFDSMLQSATDPRDHVYGILAISNIGQDVLAPDYSLSVQEVFTKTAAVVLQYYSPVFYCIYPLRCGLNEMSAHTAQDQKLPSWVPNLAARATWEVYETKEDTYWNPVVLLRTPDITPVMLPFAENPKHPCIAKFSEDYKTMCTIGNPLGTITWASVSDLFAGPGAERRLHNLYHASAKKRGFTPAIFHQAIHDFKHVYPTSSNIEYFQDFLESDISSDEINPKYEDIMADILRSASCRNLFVTDTGRFGQIYHSENDGICVGDVLVGLFGNNFPFVLRPIGAKQYKVINVAYVVEHQWGELHPAIERCEYVSWSDLEIYGLREYEII